MALLEMERRGQSPGTPEEESPAGQRGVQGVSARWAVQLPIFRPSRCPLEEWLNGGRGRGFQGWIHGAGVSCRAPELEGF